MTNVTMIIVDAENFDHQNLILNRELENDNKFCYLEAILTDTYEATKEIQRRNDTAKDAGI